MMAFLLAGIGIFTYDILNEEVDIFKSVNEYLKSIDPSIQENAAAMLIIFGVIGGTIAVGEGVIAAHNILNRYYGSKLSREAENYNYGRTGEDRLREEFIFERIKSGELPKQDFLKLRGYEL
jgi:hypothetical protein